ncbi:RNA polymerase II-associated [Entophlyctis helioformis]|nr:RNA polymerase II-associated [Entophlyctis helioformis]
MSTAKKVLQEFVHKVKYRNDLPEIPFDPKLLEYPYPEDRLYRFQANSLYASTPYPLYTADDEAGLPLCPIAHGLIEQAFRNERIEEPTVPLDPEDRALLAQPTLRVDGSAPARLRPIVPWLRRTEYISLEGRTFGRNPDAGVETKMGVSIMKDENLHKLMDRSREGQMKAIENSFDTVKKMNIKTIRHPTKPDVTPVEIFPVYPDFEFWPNSYVLATYDEDPLSKGSSTSGTKRNTEQEREHDLKLEESLIKPLKTHTDYEQQPIMALYAPTLATASKLREKRSRMEMEDYDEDEGFGQVYEYEFRRDFEPRTAELTYPFFVEIRKDDGGAFYSPITKRLTLRKKRNLNNRYEDEEIEEKPTKVVVSQRAFTESEEQEREQRMQDLLQRGDDYESS